MDNILKYSILNTTGTFPSYKENRILDEYNFESTFAELYDFMKEFAVITDDKHNGKNKPHFLY